MFKNLTMLAGAAGGVAMAVAVGAPSPSQLLAQLTGQKPGAHCQVNWGTGDKSDGQSAGPHTGRVSDLRAGAHRCYDRIVIDLGPGQKPGYQVRYVAEVDSQGSGNDGSDAAGSRPGRGMLPAAWCGGDEGAPRP